MLKTKDGLDLFTQRWTVSDPKALVLHHHGFNDHSGRSPHVARALNDAGYSLYGFDWRGQGRSGGARGHTPDYETPLDDYGLVIAEAKKDRSGKKSFPLKISILLVHGGADPVTNPKATEEFYQRVAFADKTFKRYEGQYHELHNETDPMLMLRDVVEWLSGHI